MGSFVTSVPINFVNPYMQSSLDGAVTFIYGWFSVVAVIWFWFMVSETKNWSLQELDEMLQEEINTRQFEKYSCSGLGAHITQLGGKGDMDGLEGWQGDQHDDTWGEGRRTKQAR